MMSLHLSQYMKMNSCLIDHSAEKKLVMLQNMRLRLASKGPRWYLMAKRNCV